MFRFTRLFAALLGAVLSTAHTQIFIVAVDERHHHRRVGRSGRSSDEGDVGN